MAILESVRKLAEKLGAETNGRDITDQLNKINKHLDSNGSRDIAEAVSKFADKEDGTAILTTKSITENGTYKASDDKVTGYSSVSVDVSRLNSLSAPVVIVEGTDFLLRSLYCVSCPNGYARVKDVNYGITNIILDPVKQINLISTYSGVVTFTPEEFIGFYAGGTTINVSGDTITANDGKTYTAKWSRTDAPTGGYYTVTVKKYDTNFTVTIS